MKIEILLINEEALKALADAALDSAQLAWNLSEAIEEVEKHIKRFGEKRNDLIKKFGSESKDKPGEFTVTDLVAFNAELKKLTGVDVNVKFPTIPLSAFNGMAVSAKNMKAWRQLKIVTKK